MRYLFLIVLAVMLALAGCKNGNDLNSNVPQRFTPHHFDIPYPKDYYRPANLRPMNMLEMVKYKDRSDFKFDMKIVDLNGNEIGVDSAMRVTWPVFYQFFANDSGRVVEAVQFRITKDFQKALLEWK
ncbi:MAG: hypothetical protein K1X68_14130 [Saprospiraceae bacterium]|nr:hypothetical protein [Saprospiraceae bacterium]HMW38587.1 hypothetical protein [Saprospiraceae bacterium]HMX88788.1 hypothetical protein [Saprospiraceae bacterium]HMZ40488.1 hypothetical protein [Saprospiraceae bacterium]HNA64732.1 hypothetical protein [Saprospiraceae bacterium]